MDDQVKKHVKQQNNRQINPRIIKYGLMYFLIIFIISSAYIGWNAYAILTTPNIYSGVYIGDLYVGGETKESVLESFPKLYQDELDKRLIRIMSKDKVVEFNGREVDAIYDIENAVSKAFEIGRDGNIIRRISTIANIKKNLTTIPLKINIDLEKLEAKIKELAEQVDIPVKEYQTIIEADRLTIINGISGETINISKAVNRVLDAINSGSTENIVLPVETVKPEEIDVDKLYAQVSREPENARYEVKNYRLEIIPHKEGITFDKLQAETILKNHTLEGEEYSIPLKITQPEVLKESIEKNLFRDKLSSYTTSFNANYIERSHNINLSGKAIDGTVIGPGQVFSYNDVVGDRTYETGYKNAKVYVGNQIVDGVGGGICQVSTTLYNAALFSDLEITNRANHSMTVSYVPLGQDAAVAYDLLDLAFRNNTEWPIRLNCIVRGGQITFEIWGTKSGPEKVIELENVIIKTIPFTTRYIDDPEMEEGKTSVEQWGSNGYVVDTYKITKVDGKVISKKKISTSSYVPIEQIEKRGTKKADGTSVDGGDKGIEEPDSQSDKQQTDSQETQGDRAVSEIPSSTDEIDQDGTTISEDMSV